MISFFFYLVLVFLVMTALDAQWGWAFIWFVVMLVLSDMT